MTCLRGLYSQIHGCRKSSYSIVIRGLPGVYQGFFPSHRGIPDVPGRKCVKKLVFAPGSRRYGMDPGYGRRRSTRLNDDAGAGFPAPGCAPINPVAANVQDFEYASLTPALAMGVTCKSAGSRRHFGVRLPTPPG